MEDSFRLFNCARCHRQVCLCPRCDRGNVYCSKLCFYLSLLERQAEAGRRYQTSPQGRRMHAARMARYRERQRSEQKVTHQGSPPPQPPATPALETEEEPRDGVGVVRCDVCGRLCLPFARLGPLRVRRRVRLRDLGRRRRR